jgi:hypothetical protein
MSLAMQARYGDRGHDFKHVFEPRVARHARTRVRVVLEIVRTGALSSYMCSIERLIEPSRKQQREATVGGHL